MANGGKVEIEQLTSYLNDAPDRVAIARESLNRFTDLHPFLEGRGLRSDIAIEEALIDEDLTRSTVTYT